MKTQIKKDVMHYALYAMALLLIIPFNLPGRMLPYLDLYHDVFVVFTICLLFIIVLSYQLSLPLSRPAVYFFLLAGYWVLQSVLLDLPYPDQNWRVALMFMALVALCWSIQVLLKYYGREKVETWLMWAIIIGVVIQSAVVILQFTGIANKLLWLVYYYKDGVNGQLGQRNLLGHQLMWGVLATTYLTAQGRVRFWLGIGMIAFFGAIMGLVNSRSIVAYIVALLFLLTVARIFGGRQQGKVLKYLFFAVIWVFIAQWLIPFALDFWGISAQSGVKRLLVNSLIRERLIEWQKAWNIFLDNPIWGSGWHSYAYQSFLRDIDFKPMESYHQPGFPEHCHNSVLQILAEMGASGLILVLGGFIWMTLPMLKHIQKGGNLIILALLTVTLSHSMVEFPLWSTYFLAATALFIAVGQPQSSQTPKENIHIPRGVRFLLLVTGISGAMVTATLFGLNQWRISQLIKDTQGEVDMPTIRFHTGLKLGTIIPLLSPYRDFGKLIDVKADEKMIDQDIVIFADKLSRYQPTGPVVMLHGLYLYRQGKKQESLEWMKKVWNFYPRLVPYTMKTIYDASPMFKELEQPVYDTCVRLHRLNLYPKTFNSECLQPPDKIAQKDKAENAAQSVVESTAESTTEKDLE